MDKDTLVRNAVIKALGDAIEGNDKGDYGICDIVCDAVRKVFTIDYLDRWNYFGIYEFKLEKLFEEWDKYNGNNLYPVEGSFIEYMNNHCWTGKYAERRRDLAIHIINALSRE